ncbi:unnamed protein product [Gordionus sp. m RMFG-2023]
MERYLKSNSCRRKILLSYFDSSNDSSKEMANMKIDSLICCDNCRKITTVKSRVIQNRLTGSPSSFLVPESNDWLNKTDEMARVLKIDLNPDSTTINKLVNDGLDDFTQEAIHLFNAVTALGSRYGINIPIFLLRGSHNKRLLAKFHSHSLFGIGDYFSEKWWKIFARQLLIEGFLEEKVLSEKFFGALIGLTEKAQTWLKVYGLNPEDNKFLMSSNAELALITRQEKNNKAKKEAPTSNKVFHNNVEKLNHPITKSEEFVFSDLNPEDFNHDEINDIVIPIRNGHDIKIGNISINTKPETKDSSYTKPEIKDSFLNTKPELNDYVLNKPETKDPSQINVKLYQKLLAMRSELAAEFDISPFMVASNKNLIDIIKTKPIDISHLKNLSDYSEDKIIKFGERFTNLVKEFYLPEN